MMLRGIKPPRLGSPQSFVMTRMFMMEQVQQFELLSTLAMLFRAITAGGKNANQNIQKVLESYRDSLGYARWSNDKKTLTGKVRRTDAELLARLDRITRTKKGK